ncbi:hypothetical protein [Candidatus Uabimicrobium amorphum]|uniref:Uncharacterized protein n=1 Tax=Uabimicrobium amorphum TaxID=2596890 RepID=A0A5S9ITI0_UABAM|nr:hypothetical protein [Candidatus Uabimicrobium amorphum]BBM87142.1 hypothetical protein UABAM_05545 [Candidatus Uabimicrobium amorphum]
MDSSESSFNENYSKQPSQEEYFYEYKHRRISELSFKTREEIINELSDFDLYLFSIGAAHTSLDVLRSGINKFFANKYLEKAINKRVQNLEKNKPVWCQSIDIWHYEQTKGKEVECVQKDVRDKLYNEAKKIFGKC